MDMIVSFSGAQGTGKSLTLAKVRELLSKDWKYKESFSSASLRQLYEAHDIPANVPWWELSREFQARIQMLAMLNAVTNVAEASSIGSRWLFDRSVLDALAYTIVKADQGLVDTSLVSILQATFGRTLPMLSLIVLFEPDPAYAIEASEFRKQTDQAAVAAVFSELVDELPKDIVKVIRVCRGSIEEKASSIVAAIRMMEATEAVARR